VYFSLELFPNSGLNTISPRHVDRSSVFLSWRHLRRSMFYERPWTVYHTERPSQHTARCAWASASLSVHLRQLKLVATIRTRPARDFTQTSSTAMQRQTWNSISSIIIILPDSITATVLAFYSTVTLLGGHRGWHPAGETCFRNKWSRLKSRESKKSFIWDYSQPSL